MTDVAADHAAQAEVADANSKGVSSVVFCYDVAVILLPIKLEHKLKQLFPRAEDRNRFVSQLVQDALERETETDEVRPQSIGGELHLFTDGGSRGNPGHAAIGCVLENPAKGEVVAEHCERIGVETNNVAEYKALIRGLEMAADFHPNSLVCFLDSELVVKQVNGEYRVKMPTLQPLIERIQELRNEFPSTVFRHIPRKDNFRADGLVNRALDEHPVPSDVHA